MISPDVAGAEDATAVVLIPEIVRRGFQVLLADEVSAAIPATRHERFPDERSTQRNGYRERVLPTQVSDLSRFSLENQLKAAGNEPLQPPRGCLRGKSRPKAALLLSVTAPAAIAQGSLRLARLFRSRPKLFDCVLLSLGAACLSTLNFYI